jgi:hypothetical protein
MFSPEILYGKSPDLQEIFVVGSLRRIVTEQLYIQDDFPGLWLTKALLISSPQQIHAKSPI